MKALYITILSVFTLAILHAEPTVLEAANQAYADQQYIEAATLYESLLAEEGHAPELYYNLGNAYYKMNELGKAILNYERALKLVPNYADAKFNLEFTNQQIVDNIVVTDSFFLKKWMLALIQLFNTNTWFIIATAFFILSLIAVVLFIFAGQKSTRKIAFYMGLFFLIGSISSLAFSKIQYNNTLYHQEAIIMTGAVLVKGSPDASGTELFELHEGTKVSVASELGDWYEIRLVNGNIGWVESKHIEKI